MCAKAFLLASVMLVIAGCAGNVTIPYVGINHPANPRAAATPPSSNRVIPFMEKNPQAAEGMQGLTHDSMQGMDHRSTGSMNPGSTEGMNHDAHRGMDHRSTQWNMPKMKGVPDIEGVEHEH